MTSNPISVLVLVCLAVCLLCYLLPLICKHDHYNYDDSKKYDGFYDTDWRRH